jgi:hypothetical protein
MALWRNPQKSAEMKTGIVTREQAQPTGLIARHRVAITFFGAAIAIGTFVMKDIAQDSLRKKIESQQSSASAALQRRDTLDGENAVLGVTPPADPAAMRKWAEGKLRVLDHAEDNLMNLMQALPDDDGDQARFRQLLNGTKLLIMVGTKPEVVAPQAEELYGKANAALTLVNLRAEKVRKNEERRLTIVTYGSYILVILGIVVAAIGQAYDR